MSGQSAKAGALAPWLSAGPQLPITPELAALALPSRRAPGRLIAGNVDAFPQQTPGCVLVAQLDESGGMGYMIRAMEQLRA